MNLSRFQRLVLPWVVLAFGVAIASTVRGASSDYDGDGRSDVFWRNAVTGANVIWPAGDASKRRTLRVMGPRWVVAGAGDFNGDGRTDVFWRQRDTGDNRIWFSAVAALAEQAPPLADLRWTVAGIGDFDGDGMDDVLWRHLGTGANVIWRSGGTAAPLAVHAVGNLRWVVAGIGDFDGNGRDDIFWRNVHTGANMIWRSANAATPTALPARESPYAKVVAIGDFDGDHRADVFWRDVIWGYDVIWPAGNTTGAVTVARVADQAWEPAASGDFDGDGRDDVLWRKFDSGDDLLWDGARKSGSHALAQVADLDWRAVPYEAQPTTPGLQIDDERVAEGNHGTHDVVFRIRLTHPSVQPVPYTTRPTSLDTEATLPATDGEDFIGERANGRIAPGETDASVRVAVKGDTTPEANESFSAGFSTTAIVFMFGDTGIGTIRNDDANTLWLKGASVIEGDSGIRPMSFTLHLSRPSQTAITYSIATSDYPDTLLDALATPGVDFGYKSLGGVVLPAGTTVRTFVVPVIGDRLIERGFLGQRRELLGVRLTRVTGATVINGLVPGYILDDDP